MHSQNKKKFEALFYVLIYVSFISTSASHILYEASNNLQTLIIRKRFNNWSKTQRKSKPKRTLYNVIK